MIDLAEIKLGISTFAPTAVPTHFCDVANVHYAPPSTGPLFLDICKAPDSVDSYPDADRFMYYGYKFEQLCTSDCSSQLEQSKSRQPPVVDSTSEV